MSRLTLQTTFCDTEVHGTKRKETWRPHFHMLGNPLITSLKYGLCIGRAANYKPAATRCFVVRGSQGKSRNRNVSITGPITYRAFRENTMNTIKSE